MRPSHQRRRFAPLVTLLAGAWLAPVAARAQPADPPPALAPNGEPDRNVRLRIQLDRPAIKAFEPVYLGVSADQFGTNPKRLVQLRAADGAFQDVPLGPDAWDKVYTATGANGVPVMRTGLLMAVTRGPAGNAEPQYVFAKPGEYKLRVTVGADTTTLSLSVGAPEPGDDRAYPLLAETFTQIFTEPLDGIPSEALGKACDAVLKQYPGSRCGDYCRAYDATLRFRDAFNKRGKRGGKALYAPLADQLEKSAGVFAETFFGEQLTFYTAYARGLCGDYPSVLKVAAAMKTRLTPWGDLMDKMRAEVQAHTQPTLVPVDPPEK